MFIIYLCRSRRLYYFFTATVNFSIETFVRQASLSRKGAHGSCQGSSLSVSLISSSLVLKIETLIEVYPFLVSISHFSSTKVHVLPPIELPKVKYVTKHYVSSINVINIIYKDKTFLLINSKHESQ